jgi:hypothetical protein
MNTATPEIFATPHRHILLKTEKQNGGANDVLV